jgi:hypothetical protein
MRMLAPMLLCLALTACGEDSPKPAKRIDTPQEAVSRIGDITIRANAMPTVNLNETVARGYGIPRRDGTLLLLVAVRQGPEGQDVALPATITATASNLQGQRQEIAMRELRTGDLVDYVGTVVVSPPDTLSFDLKIVLEGGASSMVQFSRDFISE